MAGSRGNKSYGPNLGHCTQMKRGSGLFAGRRIPSFEGVLGRGGNVDNFLQRSLWTGKSSFWHAFEQYVDDLQVEQTVVDDLLHMMHVVAPIMTAEILRDDFATKVVCNLQMMLTKSRANAETR